VNGPGATSVGAPSGVFVNASAVRVSDRVNVHVHDSWRLTERMIVERRLLDPVLLQAPHHGRHLILQQHEVTHHHCMVRNPLKRYPGP